MGASNVSHPGMAGGLYMHPERNRIHRQGKKTIASEGNYCIIPELYKPKQIGGVRGSEGDPKRLLKPVWVKFFSAKEIII